MARSQEDWDERIKKHGHGINTDKASGDELEDYVATKVHVHIVEDFNDFSLWACYKEEFEAFTIDTFKRLRTDTRIKLRKHLIQRGVFVAPSNSRYTISNALSDIIKEEDPHQWSYEDLGIVQGMPIVSTIIRDRIKAQGAGVTTVITPATPTPYTPTSPPIPIRAAPQPLLSEPTLYSKEITTVAKIYTDDQRYDGINDSFDFKLNIFYDICRRSGLTPEGYMSAFPTMLKGLAQEHYYSSSLSNRPFLEACNHIRQFFEGEEYYRKNLTEWNGLTLRGILDENPDKSTYQCFQLIIEKLLKLRHGIHQEFRTDLMFTNKLITACQGVEACRIAISNPNTGMSNPGTPGAGISNLIASIQSSIVAWEKENPRLIQETFYTDRRYHRNDQNRTRNQGRNLDRNRAGFRPYEHRKEDRTRPPRRKGKCYVCQKENCRSWDHTEEERKEAKDEYRKHFNTKNKGRGNFNERYRQYTIYCEGDDADECNEAFEALILDEPQGSTEDESDECYLTSFGTLTANEALSTSVELANRAYVHSLDPAPNTARNLSEFEPESDPFQYTTTTRYSSVEFVGIMIDTGASTKSTAGYGQFQALQSVDSSVTLDTPTKGQVHVQFGIGAASSIGTTDITSPIGTVRFHIIQADTPFLLCLADLDRLQVYFNNLANVIITPKGEVPVVRRYGHPFLMWNACLRVYLCDSFTSNPCFLTDVELRRLHRRFGHPSVERLYKLLYNAGHEVERETLNQLAKFCHFCQKFGKSPGRFRFTLREQDDVNFNFNIIVDVMYINNSPVLHIVDEATRFQAGRWLQDISAKHTWDILRMCWIDTYLGPPDQITHDAGKNFISKEFKHYATTMGIQTKGVPVEAHNSVGIVERYHGPLRRAYQIIAAELPGLDKSIALQMAFKALNDSAGPEGLIPTLLVFGAYPRLVESDPPAPSVSQRAAAIRKAMDEVRKLHAKRQVADAVNMRNGPRTDPVHELPPNSPVLVWREGNGGQTGQWEGPFNLLTIEGETCTVQLSRGPTQFRSTSIKPYYSDGTEPTSILAREEVDTAPERIPPGTGPDQDRLRPVQPVKRKRGRPRKHPLPEVNISAYAQTETKAHGKFAGQFVKSRQKELNGLLEKGVFQITSIDDMPPGTRLFNSRFVDEIKNPGTDKAFEKSRLVVQAYNDKGKQLVLTQSPTIQRVSQRLILCIAAIKPESKLYLRDISQAYVQSNTTLNREFYVRPPKELSQTLGIMEDTILKVVKPLYGVPEAGNHWFKTYHSHHIEQLRMDQSTYDPCLLYSPTRFGLVGLQTDDTLFLADDDFATLEQLELEKAQFLAKDREELTEKHPLKFNGGVIRLNNRVLTLTQEKQCGNLTTVKLTPSTSTNYRGITRGSLTPKDQYIAQRARGAYIASVCQPEASFDLSFAAQVINPTEADAKELNKRITWQMENPSRGLKFVKLDITTLQLLVFTDASFANNKDLSSQIGYVIALADSGKRANILHWSSIKCKRVTRSVLASELYGMAHGYDIAVAIKSTIDRILQINLPLVICIDSKSLYDCLVRLNTTQEKRLMIDVMSLRQAYERRQITEIKWIEGEANPADAMTKGKPCGALQDLINTNSIDLKAIGWVERTDGQEGGDK